MKLLLLLAIFTSGLFFSCNSFGPREIDWKNEWNKNQTKLKALAQDILSQGDKKYNPGNNNFPNGFNYPFDEGYYIETPYKNDSTDRIDYHKVTIKFYIDRGLLDHYSAFIFTTDSSSMSMLDANVANGGNDFKIEPNWYMIND